MPILWKRPKNNSKNWTFFLLFIRLIFYKDHYQNWETYLKSISVHFTLVLDSWAMDEDSELISKLAQRCRMIRMDWQQSWCWGHFQQHEKTINSKFVVIIKYCANSAFNTKVKGDCETGKGDSRYRPPLSSGMQQLNLNMKAHFLQYVKINT